MLVNDTDGDRDPLEAVLASYPAHGVVHLNRNGSFTYQADAGYTGPDSFTYEAFDGYEYSGRSAVTINVTGTPAGLPSRADPCPYDWKDCEGCCLNGDCSETSAGSNIVARVANLQAPELSTSDVSTPGVIQYYPLALGLVVGQTSKKTNKSWLESAWDAVNLYGAVSDYYEQSSKNEKAAKIAQQAHTELVLKAKMQAADPDLQVPTPTLDKLKFAKTIRDGQRAEIPWQLAALAQFSSKAKWTDWNAQEVVQGYYLAIIPNVEGSQAAVYFKVKLIRLPDKVTHTEYTTNRYDEEIEFGQVIQYGPLVQDSTILNYAKAKLRTSAAEYWGYKATWVPVWGTSIHIVDKEWGLAALSFVNDVATATTLIGGVRYLVARTGGNVVLRPVGNVRPVPPGGTAGAGRTGVGAGGATPRLALTTAERRASRLVSGRN